MSANATIKPGRELERVGRALHAGALRFPNLSTSGLRDLATLARWLVYATSDEGSNVHDVAAYLGTDLSLVRAAVDFLEGEDYLNSTIDEDHYDYAFFPTHLQLTESGIHYSADLA